MGLEPLPYRMRKNYEYQYFGRYWTLNFFCNPTGLLAIKADLASDAEIIRHRLIKRATKLPDLLRANIC
ncbi:30S ribosomal protein S6 [Mitosporidium daphniae]|uniref:30S ribosomal protein S6 n=1 Tax=Mitosporidium daphniae TaxID=1485682 RepID=A0A098VN53_9MICR|nr:30S ribosomal protein S6 [Mitosporidium daphniae]KGG50507.1 30S ribosomal protein S6 [Mitosporidium daphniae]|eukprot:XP_013236934.1 30S ribosomal protein S6 [Mitosporidium daphniae]